MSVFVDEIAKIVGLPLDEIKNKYKIVNVAGKSCRITGYQKILVYEKEKVVLKVVKDELVIRGNNLVIAEMEQGEILLTGDIYACYLASVKELL